MSGCSVEFFPPKTAEGAERLRGVAARIAALRPAYVSVTFGAGGSTRQGTLETVRWLCERGDVPVAPHISCIASSRREIEELLVEYGNLGVERLVALRGDMPSGSGAARGEFAHANELVAFIRERFGDQFRIEVAAYPEFHPQAISASDDLDNFCRKVRAGADGAVTQYFYSVDAYRQFLSDISARGITVPVVPGIMPITNYTQLARFSAACGAEIPRWLAWRLKDFGDDIAAIRDFGYQVTRRLCEELLASGAPGLHFYSMNRADLVERLWRDLGLEAY